MKPLKRSPVNKHSSASKFRSHVGRTQVANVVNAPMRGGIRF
jgi:hypothetical protein